MKLPGILLATLVLTGCAGSASNDPYGAIRNSINLRDQRVMLSTFPRIQAALMRHQAACGINYHFALAPRETSFANIVYRPANPNADDPTLLSDLAWLQPTFRQEARVKFTTYTDYASSAAEARVQALFVAIEHPEECSGKPPEKKD